MGVWVSLDPHLLPPPSNRLRRKLRRVVIDAHAHPALVLSEIKHPVGNDLPHLRIREVVHVDLLRLALGLPLAPAILVLTDEFLLLRVHRDHWLAALLQSLDHCIDVLELSVAVRVRSAFLRLAVALQAVTFGPEQRAYRPRSNGVRLLGQFLSQPGRALAGPAQWRHRVTATRRLHQEFKRRQQARVSYGQPFAATTFPA